MYLNILLIILLSSPNNFSNAQTNPNNDPTTSYGAKVSSSDIRKLAHLDASSTPPKIVNVKDFKAKGDGRTDDTEAFRKAWKVACSYKNGVFVVPKNKKYLLRPITFSGPCKSSLTMNLDGTIIASGDRSHYEKDRRHWIMFENLANFKLQGGGTVDGNGKIWWQNSCKINKKLPCKMAPTAVTFYDNKNLRVENLSVKNAQQMQISFETCVNVEAVNVTVTAPEDSPNTDGIHISNTQNIQISKCTIKTGDDCISIESGSKNVKATDIICGPGHGISIGSLGSDNEAAYVSDVFVNRAKISGATNGVRIKTYQGGSGYAKNIKFQNIQMYNVTNPIIIDQHYCDQDKPCKEQSSAVQVQNVGYKNIKGTSNSDIAVKFDCSKKYKCQGIVLQDVNLVRHADGRNAVSTCANVKLAQIGKVTPKCS